MLLMGLSALVLGQCESPTVCQVLEAPHTFNGRMVTVRGSVQIGFETFTLSGSECTRGTEPIWLEYGSGPKRQPTTWCCGDLPSHDPLRVKQDAEFRRFHQLLTKLVKRNDRREVLVTITGRIDAVPTRPCPNGESRCCAQPGFGHLGFACARLVIQSVSNVR